MKKLVVQLRADGSVAAETFGMTGPECLDYIQQLEALLDAETTSSQFTDDYRRVETTAASDTYVEEDL